MPIDSKHPAYVAHEDDYEQMRDTIEGERAVRSKITKYLPPPPGMDNSRAINLNDILRGSAGSQTHDRYTFYASFAEFPSLTAMTINALQGLVHERPPVIELPERMQYLAEDATPEGDTLGELWEQMTREVFSVGRFGLLNEVLEDAVYMCPYIGESVINWHLLPKRSGGDAYLIVLHEVSDQPKEGDKYEREKVEKWRELHLEADGVTAIYRVRVWQAKDGADPAVIINDSTDPNGWVTPALFGRSFDFIPMTIANAVEEGFKYGPMPLLPVSRRCLTIFRKTADYNRALYIKGDPQPVLFGVDSDEVPGEIGGSKIWNFTNPEASAMYLDIDGQGIPLMREAINDQYDRVAQEVGLLVDKDDSGPESGEALKRRQQNSQITVKSVVINAASAMQTQLRLVGAQLGLSQSEIDKISFTANTDFAEPLMDGKSLLDYVMSRNAGAPLSLQTIHQLMRRHKVTELEYEDELGLLETEGFNEPEPEPDMPEDDDEQPAPEDDEEENEDRKDEEA